MAMKAEPLLAGRAEGRVLALAAPISFWGGVSPRTGDIIEARHADRGSCLSGVIVGLPGTIGSSSASSVLLELIRIGRAPAALLMDHVDAVLLIGALVAEEMGWPPPPAFLLPQELQRRLAGRRIAIAEDGAIEEL
jgi:predicted aconitase with swiveling domain